MLDASFRDLMNYSYHNLGFVSKDKFNSLINNTSNKLQINNGYLYLNGPNMILVLVL